LLTQSSANATRHVCAAFRQENAFLLCNVPTVVYRHENCCNNPAGLAARTMVRRRNISYGT
ncbi:MAG: hypothetical protein MGG11_21785, partial [Trichodesmium sp. MAG_R03]|nr:hypothetical protein [Trichodesmium sp. MAG_R03]